MSDTRTLYVFAELSLAAYAHAQPNVDPRPALADAGMSQHQASRFADAWTVVDTYQHVNDPYPIYDPNTGEFLGNFSGTNGLSATIFRNIQTGEVVLSVRGTNDVNDILADIEVAALGEPPRQGQYQSLRQRMLQWIRDEKLPTQFAVTGHSLGGFLATGLALEFPQYVTHAYAYNAPGLGGLTNRPVIDTMLAHAYDKDRATVAKALRAVAGLPRVEIEDARTVAVALDWVDRGLDFADALHVASRGEARGFLTFDRTLVRRANRIDGADVRPA